MSKRHPIQPEMPPVARKRAKAPPAPFERPPGRFSEGRPSDRETRIITPLRWHPRGDATTEPLHAGPEDRPIDVWAGIPGEPAVVERIHSGRNRVVARWVRPAADPHPNRREPPCDRFSICGGCPIMHLDAAGQARARLALVRDALADFGLRDRAPTVLVPSPDGDEAYRHTVKLTVGRSDIGHLRVGVFARNSHRVVAIPGCLVATPTLRRVMSQVAHHVLELDIWPWDPETDQGSMRHVVLRQSRATGEVLATLIAGRSNRALRDLAEAIASTSPEVTGIHLHFNDDPGNSIFQRDESGVVPTLRLQGTDLLDEKLIDLPLWVGPGDFYQQNPAMADRIVGDILALLEPDRDRPALDLYCGVGGMTLHLARAHGWALGVEVVGGAVLRARENARRNRVQAEFLAGDVAESLPELRQRLDGRHPVIVVDPARRGLSEGVAAALSSLEPARLVYLSCNPRALARDLAELQELGWTLRELRAYDMFPQTMHVEVLALLDPPRAPGDSRPPPRRQVVR